MVCRAIGANFALIVVVGLGLSGCFGGAAPTATPRVQEPATSTVIDVTGAGLYVTNCQVCHGDEQGQGGTGAPSHNQDGHTWHHPDAQLKDWVINGKMGFGLMPPFKDKLTEQDVDAILAHIKTWWTEDQRRGQADISQRYQQALDAQKKSK